MRAEPCRDCGVVMQQHAAGCFTAAVERGEITERDRQVQIALRARERQVTELREQEVRLGCCPGCMRVGRRLGDHDCDAALAIDEARERIQAQGGAVYVNRTRIKGAKITGLVIDELSDAIAQQGRLANAAKVSAAAMQRLNDAFGAPAGNDVADYKGIKLTIDPALPDDTLVLQSNSGVALRSDGFAETLSFEEVARRLYGVPPITTRLRALDGLSS